MTREGDEEMSFVASGRLKNEFIEGDLRESSGILSVMDRNNSSPSFLESGNKGSGFGLPVVDEFLQIVN